jgi:hypothetical protein
MKYVISVFILTTSLAACTAQVVTPTPSPISSTATSQITNLPTESPSKQTNTSIWKEYSIPAVGITLRLPPKLDSLGKVTQQIVAGESGTQLCIQFTKPTAWYNKLIPEVEAGGGCGTLPNKYIAMGTTSVDYSAGREGNFFDIQGFAKSNNKYLIRFVGGQLNESFDQELITPLYNPNNVEIIKIRGKAYPDDGPSLRSSLGNNLTGAIVNTKTKTYTGLNFTFTNELSESEIDNILASIKHIL